MSIFQKKVLIFSFKDGDKISIKEVYDKFFISLCSFSYNFTKNDEASSDIVQEVFIKLWENKKNFISIYSLRSFLYLSVKNASLNYNRDNKKLVTLETAKELENEENELIIKEEVHRLIYNEIEKLPEMCKKVIKLSLLDMKISDIAEVLNIAENTVKNHKSKAKSELKKNLKNLYSLLFLI
jgi:RNA polymerase sigma-70 factor (ECF subfamily)